MDKMIYGSILFAPDTGGSGAEGDTKPKVKEQTDPRKEYQQIASELKNLISTQAERGKEEFKESFEKLNNRLDDLEFDHEKVKKDVSERYKENAGKYQHAGLFKNALLDFAKGNHNALHEKVGAGSLEVKSGYHPSYNQKSDNIVRYDQTSGAALLLPDEVSTDMLYNAIEATPIAQLVSTTTTSRPNKKITLRTGTPGIQWIGEEGEVDKKKMTYKVITLTPKKGACRYGMSIEQEEDSAWDPIGEMMKAFEEDFRVGVGSAALTGNGVDRPTGMIGNLTGHNSGGQALTTDMLIALQESILEEYQDNGSWLFNRTTRANIRSLVLSSTNGLQYTWEPDFQRKSPTLLLGDPVFIARKADMAGVLTGNFTVGDVPILYGDFRRAYELVVRTDMYMIDDPFSESKSFIRNLAIMSRVDGKPTQTEAAAELRITAS